MGPRSRITTMQDKEQGRWLIKMRLSGWSMARAAEVAKGVVPVAMQGLGPGRGWARAPGPLSCGASGQQASCLLTIGRTEVFQPQHLLLIPSPSSSTSTSTDISC